MRGRGRTHILSSGQGGLHDVLHVRGREETPHAVPVESGVQSERERLRLAGERRGLYATHAGPANVQTSLMAFIGALLYTEHIITYRACHPVPQNHYFNNYIYLLQLICLFSPSLSLSLSLSLVNNNNAEYYYCYILFIYTYALTPDFIIIILLQTFFFQYII